MAAPEQHVPATRVSELIGSKLLAWREDAGLSQDEVARLLRDRHLRWWRSTVSAVEVGSREVTIGELLALADLMALALTDLVATDGRVEVAPGCAVSGEYLRLLFTGPTPDQARASLGIGADETFVSGEDYGWTTSGGSAVDRRVVLAARQDAEIKAAKRLGITVLDVAALSVHLWGRSLTEERDTRLADTSDGEGSQRSTQAQRGHITRGLIGELAARTDDIPAARSAVGVDPSDLLVDIDILERTDG